MALLGTPNAYLGLDIGTHSVKLVELINRGRKHELATYAIAPLSPSVKTVDLISRMLEQAEASADAVFISLPNNAVFSIKLTLPDMPATELSAAIRFKAREVVPTSLEEVKLHWFRIPGGVYLVAAAKTAINHVNSLTKQLNLKLLGFEAEIFSLLRAHAFTTKQNILLCNIGGKETTLHIVGRGFPVSSRTLPLGTGQLNERDPNSFQPLLQEISRTVAGQQISKTVLAGGGANIIQLKALFTRQLGIQPVVSNPWQSLAHPEGLEKSLARLGPQLAVAVGLALSGIIKRRN